ncbi:MAG: hypothetical protein KTR31_21300 [Myxococcales bacterium]|nr:hypothetical protein [Myxococcales bacterium]
MLLSLLTTTSLAATFAEVPDMASLASSSAGVVRGTVVATVTTPCPLGLCSTHTIVVEETLTGSAPDELTVVLPGGRHEGLVQRVSGVPDWTVDTAVVLFVARDGTVPLTGMLTLRDERPEDPLSRAIPSTLFDLTSLVRDARFQP